MSHADERIPAYTRHRASGQAVVRLDGRDFYLGKWKSAASRAEYDRLIREWLTAGRCLPVAPNSATIAEIVVQFRRYAKQYYRHADGTPTGEAGSFDIAVRPLLKLYGKTPAVEFGPLRLETVRDEMICGGMVRTSINKNVSRIRHIFKWASAKELIPASVWQALQSLKGLSIGRSNAMESEPVKPVKVTDVEAVLPFVSKQVFAMIRLQLVTGMRSGEVVLMRTGDIDRTGKLWVYRPTSHKTLHHGHTREVYLGPKAQEIVTPFLKLNPSAYIFNPREADRERRDELHARRTTPITCGNRPGTNRRQSPKRSIGERYDAAAYRRAVARACDKAEIPSWHPHQLRHTAATELRRTHGIEAAQVILGHRTLDVTQLYAERNVAAAMKIMGEVG